MSSSLFPLCCITAADIRRRQCAHYHGSLPQRHSMPLGANHLVIAGAVGIAGVFAIKTQVSDWAERKESAKRKKDEQEMFQEYEDRKARAEAKGEDEASARQLSDTMLFFRRFQKLVDDLIDSVARLGKDLNRTTLALPLLKPDGGLSDSAAEVVLGCCLALGQKDALHALISRVGAPPPATAVGTLSPATVQRLVAHLRATASLPSTAVATSRGSCLVFSAMCSTWRPGVTRRNPLLYGWTSVTSSCQQRRRGGWPCARCPASPTASATAWRPGRRSSPRYRARSSSSRSTAAC